MYIYEDGHLDKLIKLGVEPAKAKEFLFFQMPRILGKKVEVYSRFYNLITKNDMEDLLKDDAKREFVFLDFLSMNPRLDTSQLVMFFKMVKN